MTVKCGEEQERVKERFEDVRLTSVVWCDLDTSDNT